MASKLGEIFLPEFDREMPRTRKVLEAVTTDSMNWKPAEGLRTIGWNANHLLDIVDWTLGIVNSPEFDLAPPNEPAPKVSALTDPAQIVEGYDRVCAIARETIAAATDDQMEEPWSLKHGGAVLFTIPKGECLRTWVFNHSVHHRGILSVYLRMHGVELTPVYDG